MEKLFVIGSGGTGMRCLQAFVHLCAMGMFDDKEIHLLALDTDLDNANFADLKKLINDCYLPIKGQDEAKRTALKDTFFSANIKFYKFSPDYSKTDTQNPSKIFGLLHEDKNSTDLANLLFTKNVQEFDLKHGYRTQTHMGSMLMYNGILEAVNDLNTDIARFLKALLDESQTGTEAKVFVMGSVFGGTGASSIPVVPLALRDAAFKAFNKAALTNIRYGAALLTHYFTFNLASDTERAREKVLADAKNFPINSQAALMFYENDKTVIETYDSFYIIGTENSTYQLIPNQKDTITGGDKQRNQSHYLELIAAGAAHSFFNTNTVNDSAVYYFKSIDQTGALDFKDFINNDTFIKRFTWFTAMAFLVNWDNTDFIKADRNNKIEGETNYHQLGKEEVDALKRYFCFYLFGFRDNAGSLQNDWLRQLHRSAGGNNNLLFNPDIFSENVANIKFHEIFSNPKYKMHNLDISWGFTSAVGRTFDKFKDTFVKNTSHVSLNNLLEAMIKRMYDTLALLYKF